MPEFLELTPPDKALNILLESVQGKLGEELVETKNALGRVNVSAVTASEPLPSFARSTVDGYAVSAADTYGASDSLPVYLDVVGEILMGTEPSFSLLPAQCALIHTGGMIPDGADAVVMVEYTQSSRLSEVEILRSVAFAENVIKIGEDVKAGQEVISAGKRLRAAEIGGLMALGIDKLKVYSKPRVGIISSGDEVVQPWSSLTPGQVRDVNSYSLSALIEDAGGTPHRYGIVPDKFETLLDMAQKAMTECDLVIITAGSSVSARDLTVQVIEKLGAPGVLVHGVNVRPGKPTILAVCNGKTVIGLPGNPVSALVIAGLFVVPLIEKLSGIKQPKHKPMILARLEINLPSQTGRDDWVAVRLTRAADGYRAEPIFGKSNLIFTLVRADGLLRIPAESNGLSAGEQIEVILL